MNDTYNFRSLLMEYQRISIPKIQRDYAQGRLTGKAPDVRENFLNDIFSGKVMSLDFIFGTAQECDNQKKFIPLDGQQRLTTLFLLYMYGIKTHILETNNLDLKKFTYETRKAARDFCHEIVTNEWPEISQGTAIRDAIVKQKWFMNYWLKDPTVEGMLTMLDAIHGKATKFNYPDLDNIKFRFFDMNEHNLSDNLYIKMNSRGKPLTAFENLKASIDKILPEKTGKLSSFDWLSDDEDLKKKTTFDEQWKHCIDRQWTDMFWGYKENYLSDPPFLRFIVNMLSAYWIGFNKIKQDDDGEKDKLLRFFLGITGNEDYISFDKFKDVLLSKTEKEENKSDNRLKTLVLLADGLNSFHKLLELDNLPEICRPSWEKNKEYDLVKNVLQLKGDRYNPSNKERAMFYALVKCPYISLIEENNDETIAKIKHWMRVFWNIVEQEQERVRNFIGAVHLINELSLKIAGDKCADIYEWLAKESNVNGINSGFMKDQVKEEHCKAIQIQENTFKEQDIIYAESHPLLKGCISTLFEDDSCKKVSFENSIKERVGLLEKLCDNDNDYNLVQVLISLYDKEKPEGKLYLKKNQENWKSLVTYKLKECFRKNKNNEIKQDCQGWKSMLANSLLINNSRDDGKIISTYGNGNVVLWATGGCTWNAYGNVILDDMHNNQVLNKLLERNVIECNQKIENCNFFWGWDINFKFHKDSNSYDFQWNTDGNVYLFENYSRKKKEDGSDYCFKADVIDDSDSEKFTNELNCLIAQAFPDADKSVCEDCQDKICEFAPE